MTTVGRNEWLDELNRVMGSRAGDDGLTSREIADLLGVSVRTVLERLQRMRGRVVSGRKPHTGLDGRTSMVACYRLEPVPKAAKRR